jgi:transcriptional regulator GlxA family with amidase domain
VYVPPLPFELRLEFHELGQRLIHELREVHGLGQAMADALLTEIIVKAQRQLMGPRRVAESPGAAQLEAICEAIAADPSEPVTLAASARVAGMSRTAFSVAFKQHTGMTLIDYVLATRIQHAQRDLESTDHPVSAVAGRVGFRNLGHFHATFRKLCGMTPRQYRRLSEAQGARA